ncbi:MAG: hypothetical protein NTX88_03085 [Candidatus Atribacteria bacterium]|nr:hypothetical protein [Candidatus Atribacteria bacterium]
MGSEEIPLRFDRYGILSHLQNTPAHFTIGYHIGKSCPLTDGFSNIQNILSSLERHAKFLDSEK